jgi:hypothetical protein
MVVNHIVTTNIYTPEEIKMVVDKANLVDPALLDKARTIVLTTAGLEGIEEPERPAPEMTIDLDPAIQLKLEQDYQAELREYNKVMGTVDAIAEPVAIDMLIDEVQNLKDGEFGVKVALAQASITYKQQAMADVFDTNEALIASGHQPLSRPTLLMATEMPNKEAELARG